MPTAHLQKASPTELRNLPKVRERLERVRQSRLESKSPPTQALAQTPTQYHVTVLPETPFLAIPKVSSEKREYLPIAYLEPPTIPSDLVFVFPGASYWYFALLTSRIHMAWMRSVGGKLESRYRYSINIVYNNFPLPTLTDADKEKIGTLAQRVLEARAAFPDSSLADLYDSLTMPPVLRKAHQSLDAAVDKFYRPNGFTDDRERVEHLLALYETLSEPLLSGLHTKQKRRKGS